MIHPNPATSALVLLIVLLAACGSEGDGPPPPSPSTPGTTSGGWTPNLDDERIDDAEWQQLANATELQAAAAEDGVITFAEYEAVVLETIACWEKVGYAPTHGLRLTVYGYYYLVYGPAPGSGSAGPPADARDMVVREGAEAAPARSGRRITFHLAVCGRK